jgi:hypothetical protein
MLEILKQFISKTMEDDTGSLQKRVSTQIAIVAAVAF